MEKTRVALRHALGGGDKSTPPKVRHFRALPGVVAYDSDYFSEFVPHSHDFLTLVTVTRGAFRLRVDNFVGRVDEGDFIAIGPGQIHAAQPISKDGWAMRTIQAPLFAVLDDDTHTREHYSLAKFSSPVLRCEQAGALLIDRLQSAHYCQDETASKIEFAKLKTWFRETVSCLSVTRAGNEVLDAELQSATKLLLNAIYEGSTIEHIAQESGLSVYSFIRRFKKEHGVSPHAWRILRRIEEGARMLRKGESIAHIAYDCGFADQAHFCRSFRRVYGVTPGQYRIPPSPNGLA